MLASALKHPHFLFESSLARSAISNISDEAPVIEQFLLCHGSIALSLVAGNQEEIDVSSNLKAMRKVVNVQRVAASKSSRFMQFLASPRLGSRP